LKKGLYGNEDESGDIFHNFTENSEHFLWIRQTCLDWEPTVQDVDDPSNHFSFTHNCLVDRILDIDEPSQATKKFKRNYYTAVARFNENLRLKDFGCMEKTPVVMSNDECILVLNVVFVKKESLLADSIKSSGCSWSSHKKINQNVYLNDNQSMYFLKYCL
jgi:hypothetical protein